MSYVCDRRVGTQSAGSPRLGSTNPAVPVLLSMGVNEPLSKVFTCNEFKDVDLSYYLPSTLSIDQLDF